MQFWSNALPSFGRRNRRHRHRQRTGRFAFERGDLDGRRVTYCVVQRFVWWLAQFVALHHEPFWHRNHFRASARHRRLAQSRSPQHQAVFW
jgi:hypothetical protein